MKRNKNIALLLSLTLAFQNLAMVNVFAEQDPTEQESYIAESDETSVEENLEITYDEEISEIPAIDETTTDEAVIVEVKEVPVDKIMLRASTSKKDVSSNIAATKNYYSNKKNNIFDKWDEIGAGVSAYGNVNGYTLPNYETLSYPSASSISGRILELLAIGKDPRNTLGGRNLVSELVALQDSSTGRFGSFINDHIWAMVALNASAGSYDKDKAVEYLNTYYTNEESTEWSYKPPKSFGDADTAGMMLLALATAGSDNSAATSLKELAVDYLKSSQLQDGGWKSMWDTDEISNSNSTATVVMGLIAVGEDLDSAIWQKDRSPIERILQFQNADGGFRFAISGGSSDDFSTPQCLMALGDYKNGRQIWLSLPAAGAVYEITMDDLNKEIERTNAIDKSPYTPASVSTLNKALENAIALSSNSGATQTEIYNTVSALRLALRGLKEADSEGGETINVTMSVKSKSDRGTIVASQNFEISENDTVFTLLTNTLDNRGITYDYRGSGTTVYITEIDGLKEFDDGPLSGWQYSVNGEKKSVSCGQYYMEPGDTVEWVYYLDYTKEPDYAGFSGSSNKVVTGYELSRYKSYKDTTNVVSEEKTNAVLNKGFEFVSNSEYISLWTANFMAISNGVVPESAIAEINEELKANNGDYRLPTDLAKTALSLQLYGYDIKDYNGINLLDKIYNYKDVEKQGVNGCIYALLVMDNEPTTYGDAVNSKKRMIEKISSYQNSDGGFSLAPGAVSEVDITAMAITALARHKDDENVAKSLGKAMSYLESQVKGDLQSSESFAQVIIALSHLAVSPDNENFVYEGKTLTERLLEFQNPDGTFSHSAVGGYDEIATEQGLLAMQSYKNLYSGLNPIYVVDTNSTEDKPVIIQDKAIIDEAVEYSIIPEEYEIEDLSSDVSRAEFIYFLINAKKLPEHKPKQLTFSDVNEDNKFVYFVERAVLHSITSGKGDGLFLPDESLTKEELATFLNNAFIINTEDTVEIADIDSAYSYSKTAIENCVAAGIIELDENNNFNPKDTVTYEESLQALVKTVSE